MVDISSLYWYNSDDVTRQSIMTMFKTVIDLDPEKFTSHFQELCTGFTSFLFKIKDSLIPDNLCMEQNMQQPTKLSKKKLLEVVYSILDFSVTLSSFIHCYPPSACVFHDKNLMSNIMSFYDSVFPHLQREIKVKFSADEVNFPSLCPDDDLLDQTISIHSVKETFLMSKSMLIKSVRQIIEEASLTPLLDENIDVNSKGMYFDILSDTLIFAVSLKSFYQDYIMNFPIESDLQVLAASPVSGFSLIDPTRIEYLSKILEEESALKTSLKKSDTSVWQVIEDQKDSEFVSKKNRKKREGKKEERTSTPTATTAEKGMEEVELASLISSVKDILPDLGEGFIELCLESFGYNSEQTLNALLVDDLPQEIKTLNRSLSRSDVKDIRSLTAKKREPEPSLLVPEVIASRANIYDGDEFDIHRNKTIDLSRVHVGKRDVNFVPGSVGSDLKKKTLFLQEVIKLEEEEEELKQLAELGILDPNDFFVG